MISPTLQTNTSFIDKTLKYYLASFLGVLFIFWGVPCLICTMSGPAIGNAPNTRVEIQGNQMILQGNINNDLAERVRLEIAKPHNKVDIVMISSIGGEEPAAFNILKYLNTIGIRKTVVPPNFYCESACIVFTLDTSSEFVPADSAKLMFHRGFKRLGPDTCWACRVAHYEGNKFSDIVFGKESHRQMYGWAEFMAPGLGAALARCKPDPFDDMDGIIITGAEFKAFQGGQADAIKCPSK